MSRNRDEWLAEVNEDMGIIARNLREGVSPEGTPLNFGVALKEAQRLLDDIYRIAGDICGLTREQVNEARKGL